MFWRNNRKPQETGGPSRFTAQPPPLPLKGKQILIVDDDKVIVNAYSQKLTSDGFAVLSCSECSHALHSIREERPDLVLLDISFPPDFTPLSDGLKLLQWLRQYRDRPPVIVITGNEDSCLRERALALGADGFFCKSAGYPALNAAIMKTLCPDQKAVAA